MFWPSFKILPTVTPSTILNRISTGAVASGRKKEPRIARSALALVGLRGQSNRVLGYALCFDTQCETLPFDGALGHRVGGVALAEWPVSKTAYGEVGFRGYGWNVSTKPDEIFLARTA
jgi:hypothetical protein